MFAIELKGSIDLGQLLISGITSCLFIIGWFIKRELSTIASRLDRHEELIFDLSNNIQMLTGLQRRKDT